MMPEASKVRIVPGMIDTPETSTGDWAGAASNDAGLAPGPGESALAVVPMGMPASHGSAVAGTVILILLAAIDGSDAAKQNAAVTKHRIVSFIVRFLDCVVRLEL